MNYIFNLLFSSKYKELNNSNYINQMVPRFERVYLRLEKLPETIVLSNEDLFPNKIKTSWEQLDASFDGTITESIKKDYGILIKKTASFLKYIESLPASKNEKATSFNARSIDVNEEKEKRLQLKKQYDKLKVLIESKRNATDFDPQTIESLQEQLDAIAQKMKEFKENVESANADQTAETNWADRIEQAFNDLSVYTQPIEKEKVKVTVEYWGFLIATWILVILFCILYYLFIKEVQECKIILCSWLDYLPYGILLPVYSLLIWLCVYQKNRAHKISIELTTRLFNIQYLEGLLKLTNTLSANPNEAINKIDHAVDSMLQSYLKQADHNQLSEVELSRIEVKELEGTPYWKLLQEIKELIKTIKQ